MEVNKNQITVDLAKIHIYDNVDRAILINDILKLIDIIEKRSINNINKEITKRLIRGRQHYSDSQETFSKIERAISKIFEK